MQSQDCRVSFLEAPRRRVRAELYCLYRTFWFHEDNNDGRKAATLLVVGAWALIEAGAAFEYATLPDQFFFLRVVVGVLIGRMWGIEINNFAGVEFGYTTSDDDSKSNGGAENGDE